MDLWSLFSRLRERKGVLVVIVLVSLLLGILGWVNTTPAYTLTAAQALRSSQESADGKVVTTTGSFELGMIGAMLVQNTASRAGEFDGAVVTSTNAVVSPPAAIPLITTSVTADSSEQASAALNESRAMNARFLRNLLAAGKADASVSIVNMPYTQTPSVSTRPKVRSAGVGAILGGLTGLTALLVWDALQRRRREPHGWTHNDRPDRV
ncbi:hypothetical protein [Mobilicoccus pelagius]|uniref:Polysaccharide chain length determinant N-terminal domain-containing protein n=1 Tax=Mobilicoccus pelagius NBRC 104925 TaxID=1089455 RepID=H5USE0_9MICO|nr:hypothetical protein [Mobilicoccus pelagius]GAB48648.1 hypothetical protein MOPEL_078_00370 [Mobilicoccus pelagius NBRC 104925]